MGYGIARRWEAYTEYYIPSQPPAARRSFMPLAPAIITRLTTNRQAASSWGKGHWPNSAYQARTGSLLRTPPLDWGIHPPLQNQAGLGTWRGSFHSFTYGQSTISQTIFSIVKPEIVPAFPASFLYLSSASEQSAQLGFLPFSPSHIRLINSATQDPVDQPRRHHPFPFDPSIEPLRTTSFKMPRVSLVRLPAPVSGSSSSQPERVVLIACFTGQVHPARLR